MKKIMFVLVVGILFVGVGNLYAQDAKLTVTGETYLATESGNVGIGTTGPDHKLVVGPAGGGRHLVINDIATARWGFATGNHDLAIQNDWGGTWNTRMLINENGNVGIGTTGPQGPLHILDSTQTAIPSILVERSSGAGQMSPRIGFVDTDLGAVTTAPAWFIDNLADSFRIFRQPNINTAGVTPLLINNTGNVGIGTTEPNWGKLQISSDGVGSPPRIVTLQSNNEQSGRWRWIDFIRQGFDSEFIVYGNGEVRADGSFSQPADYAEYFYSEDTTLKPGELVGIAGENKIKRCKKDETLIGVVSTNPGIVGIYADDVTDAAERYEKDPHWVKVGLLGQIPIEVSVSNGVIKAGDQLTVGDNGVAVKGESPRTLLILALEDADEDGRIKALIK